MTYDLVIIQHTEITVRIQDKMFALRTYYNSYLGADKARSASAAPQRGMRSIPSLGC